MIIRILQPCQVATGYNILLPNTIVDAPETLAQCWIVSGRAEEADDITHKPIKETAVKKRRRQETRNAKH
jgi:hypothetical protein